MIAELAQSKWLWVVLGSIALLVLHRLLFSKDGNTRLLEREYSEIINSDKYKVKGQHD